MVAKIGRSRNLYGVLAYNQLKVENENGQILLAHQIIETANGHYSVAQLAQSFAPYLIANRNTEKHTLHISLNPDPNDKVSDQKYREMAEEYMREMGYGEQPFVVFKHTDIDRSHIHIVSVCVDEEGKKISDQFEKVRSMKVCRELEKKFGLTSALEKKPKLNSRIFKPVNYQTGNIKSQIAPVVKQISAQYQFQSFGEYNALLSLYDITAEIVEGELHGHLQKGLLYFPTDSTGKKTGRPFKSSLFGKKAGLDSLENHIQFCKVKMRNLPGKQKLKEKIIWTLQASNDEKSFAKKLREEDIDILIRKNDKGRIYGMTFIDHRSKTVWNGSRLGKDFSANVFENKWTHPRHAVDQDMKNEHSLDPKLTQDSHQLFNVFENSGGSFFESFGGILPTVLHENEDEEIEFANRMKKRKMKRKR